MERGIEKGPVKPAISSLTSVVPILTPSGIAR